ncbi:MAG: CRISPR-associated endonuclease Cas1 [Bacteroides sp.]|nr:CRISPR-associated endonuclease Cas1 [Prevotella sp.]MCM1406943.1 CRISPR-associated endonuclease Cas1 [Treponema brennaborense]MCM1470094.1 CRISPR-associated endonuclease Cas1 [Bacteroides sp.]
MAEIYILSDYGKLSKKNETIIFSRPDGTDTVLFPFKTEHLVLIGKVSISADALRLLTKYKIGTTFLSANGRFNGKLTFGDGKNIFLRQKQFRILDNPQKSLAIARSIVLGKIRNEISFMQRIKRKNSGENTAVEDAIAAVKNTLSNAEKADDIDKLRGYEGIAARKYFEVFKFNLQDEWAEFKTRSKNPPRTNVNAVLSFLYTLLMYRVESAIEAQGLDCCCGNLHAVNYGKSALVFDLMEEFRSPICDSVCCSMFNLGILKPNDFEKKEFSAESDDFPLDSEQGKGDADLFSESQNDEENYSGCCGILLTNTGLKKVITAFEAKMNSVILYAPALQKISYAKIIYQQVLCYKRVINNEETEYKSYYFK